MAQPDALQLDMDAFFGPRGKLASILPGYMERPEQTAMASTIGRALAQKQHCLAEAGTGVGKSLAYLIPAVAWALTHETRILISTHTKALQTQLIQQELPRIAEETFFGQPIRYEMCLGAENYICLLRLIRLAHDPRGVGLDRDAGAALAYMLAWSRQEVTGLRQDLDQPVPEWLWRQVALVRETCIHRHCPYFEDCFLQQARKKQRQAHVLVSNHSLFFANIMTEGKLLPDFGAVILDEAHKVEDVATQFFSQELSQAQLTGLLHELREKGRGGILRQVRGLPEGLLADWEQQAQDVLEQQAAWWQSLSSALGQQDVLSYDDRVVLASSAPVGAMENLARGIKEAADMVETEEENKTVTLLAARLDQASRIMADWEGRQTPDMVYWAESYFFRQDHHLKINCTPLTLDKKFKMLVLESVPSVSFVSATMAINKDFRYFKSRLGINQALEIVLESPFPYEAHAALYLPKAMPEPNQGEAYVQRLQEEVLQLIRLFQGGIFVLFTNTRLMKQVAQCIKPQLKDFLLLTQGEAPVHHLLRQFKAHHHAVMLGVETFWQGVDVPGEALRCVVLTRLPFDVPTHPVMEHRADYLRRQGQNPFVSYALPRAMLMLRQGFGRLIRHHQDRGVVAILDARVQTRSWGKRFVTMLPPCARLTGLDQVEAFVQKHFGRNQSPAL